MLYESSDKLHLFSRVLEYDSGIFGLAPQAVWRHNHSQIIYVHFRDGYILSGGKDLHH